MRFFFNQDSKADAVRPRVNLIQSAPEILSMIDASSSNVPKKTVQEQDRGVLFFKDSRYRDALY